MMNMPQPWRLTLLGLALYWRLLAALYWDTGAAMVVISSADARRFAATRRGTEFASIPLGPDGRRWSVLATLGAAVTARSESRQAASDLVRHLSSPACQRAIASVGQALPALLAASPGWARSLRARGVHPSIGAFTGYRALHAPVPSLHAEAIERILDRAAVRIVRGRNPERELKAASDEATRLFAQ